MNFRITFGAPKNVTNPGQDGFQWEFPFTLVNAAFVGMPEGISKTEEHRVIVPICRTRLAGWQLKGDDLVRVLFEYGKRHVVDCVKADELPTSEFTIRYDEITNESHPETPCPFTPSRIPWPEGVQLTVPRP